MEFEYWQELRYVLLLFGLFVVPRILQRFRIPSAITCVGLGALSGLGFNLFPGDSVIALLSTFGIVALFLFAGLELELRELRGGALVIGQHLAVSFVGLIVTAVVVAQIFRLELRSAAMISLALLTPSTGFILDSLNTFSGDDRERFWIKSKAIATELLALAGLFVAMQSSSLSRLALSLLILVCLVGILPLLFRLFAVSVAPYAPKSEFAFLLMVAVVAAFVTHRLGVYYLVGAFIVGVAARRFREQLPALASERMLHAVEVFASFFIPFYFFHAGLGLRTQDFSWNALLFGLAALLAIVPLRIISVIWHRRLALQEPLTSGLRIGLALTPTLVFSLVIVEILSQKFAIPGFIHGGLIVYTLTNTLLPSLILRGPRPDFAAPQLPVQPVPEQE